MAFVHSVRGALPLVAGVLAMMVLLPKLWRQPSCRSLLFGPLGLAALYGLVGIAASLGSPDRSVALYWSTMYLSVPIVLLAVASQSGALENLRRLIRANWIILVLATVALFAIALIKLDLAAFILRPSTWLECSNVNWLNWSFSALRSTGVGRYAALAAIVALPGLWQGHWRILWGITLVVSLILLMNSGARGAIAGFAVAVPIVLLLQWGKRAAVGGAVALVILLPVVWVTGVHQPFLTNCLRIRPSTTEVQPAPSKGEQELVSVQVPSGTWAIYQRISEDSSQSDAPVVFRVPPGIWKGEQPQPEQQSSAEPSRAEPAPTEPPDKVQFPAGVWRLEEPVVADPPALVAPVTLVVPQGGLVLKRQSRVDLPTPKRTALISNEFFQFSGRREVWVKGWDLFLVSPLIGYGFHADRLILGTHMHNSFMHALVQTGLLGTIPFVGAILFAWLLLVRAIRKLSQLPVAHKQMVIQTAGVLAFLSIRSIPESTGAFFGVDWLILAPLLLYLQLVNRPAIVGNGLT